MKVQQARHKFTLGLHDAAVKPSHPLCFTDTLVCCLDFNQLRARLIHRALLCDSGLIMLEFLPKDVREGLDAARLRDQKKRSRLRVQVGGAVFPVLRFWDEGFALDASLAPNLRGLVDVYDGARHIFQCLIIASSQENGELVCDFKRSTMVADRAPLDFWRDENAPVALLPKA
ncbi:MAG: hypothetical protein RLZZ437_397 [Pseudomonadota bacterium]